jgi:hypothetical protein
MPSAVTTNVATKPQTIAACICGYRRMASAWWSTMRGIVVPSKNAAIDTIGNAISFSTPFVPPARAAARFASSRSRIHR